MAKTKKETTEVAAKRLGLFDHISAVTEYQDPQYWKNISDDDKKTFGNFIIQRYLSMNPDWIEWIADVQPYIQSLPNEYFYRFFIDMIPPKKYYLKYIKGKKANDYEDWIVDLVVKEYGCSTKHANEYLDILYSTRDGREQILSICQKYGTDKKLITSLKLKI
jgi:hypothetical protein